MQEVFRLDRFEQQGGEFSTALSLFDLRGCVDDEARPQVCVRNEPQQVLRAFDIVAFSKHERDRQDAFRARVRRSDLLQDFPRLFEVSCQGVFDGEPCQGAALLFRLQRSCQVVGERHEGLSGVFHLVLDHPSSRLGEQSALQEGVFDTANGSERVAEGVGGEHVSCDAHEIGVAFLAGWQQQGSTVSFEQQAVGRAHSALLLRIVREAQKVFQTAAAGGLQEQVVDEGVVFVLHKAERVCRQVGQRTFQEACPRANLLFPLQILGDLFKQSLPCKELSCQAKALLAAFAELAFGNALQDGEGRIQVELSESLSVGRGELRSGDRHQRSRTPNGLVDRGGEVLRRLPPARLHQRARERDLRDTAFKVLQAFLQEGSDRSPSLDDAAFARLQPFGGEKQLFGRKPSLLGFQTLRLRFRRKKPARENCAENCAERCAERCAEKCAEKCARTPLAIAQARVQTKYRHGAYRG